jgi:hypothetical protein
MFLASTHARTRRSPDRSGEYTSEIGALLVLEGPDSLVFNYGGRMGDHDCNWTGMVAALDPRHFQWKDDYTTLDITWSASFVRFRTTGLSHCGIGLGDDDFPRKTRRAARRCTVAAERAYFYPAVEDVDKPLDSYVSKGDRVDVLPNGKFHLARFRDGSKTVLGQLKLADVSCPGDRSPR